LLAAFAIWFLYDMFAMPYVHPHVGDGRFENHSWRFPYVSFGLPVPGYTINFGEHDLGAPFDVTYHIENLPDLRPQLGVYLSVADPDHVFESDDSRHQLNAMVEIDVVDGAGQSVCHVDDSLAKMWWAAPEGGPDTYGLYNSDQSFFVPKQGERYEIHARYT
jgi:hypothetical protein